MRPKVFISYSHDNKDHAARVLNLTNDLRGDGVDAIIDQYFTSPPEGWPAWMDGHIRDDDFVVMICTETYYRRVTGKEKPAVGHGVAWEGSLIYNRIYLDKCDLSRFVPVLLNGGRPDHIPDPLAGATHYLVETPHGYEGLLRQIFNRPEAQMPDLGERPPLPQRSAQWTMRPPADRSMNFSVGGSDRLGDRAVFSEALNNSVSSAFYKALPFYSASNIGLSFDDLDRIFSDIEKSCIPSICDKLSGTSEQWIELYENLPDCGALIVDKYESVVGYWFMVPIRKYLYSSIRSGNFDISDISMNNVDLIGMDGTYDFFFVDFMLMKEHRRAHVRNMMFASIIERLSIWGEFNIFARNICANTLSDEGERLCDVLGMNPVAEHSFYRRQTRSGETKSTQLYELQLLPYKEDCRIFNHYQKLANICKIFGS